MFQIVTEENIEEAALIHLLSWQESHHNLIENLYVIPDQQRKGYGEMLLNYVEEQCEGVPTLWILSNNDIELMYMNAKVRAGGNGHE